MKLLLVLLFFGLFLNPVFTHGDFSDVAREHANREAIDYVFAQKIVDGYQDGTFRPDALINRAEFTKIVVGARFEQEVIERCIPENRQAGWTYAFFRDVPLNQWFTPYICVAKLNGIIAGYPDGRFLPAANINFAEAAKIIANAFSIPASPDETWYKPFVTALGMKGAIPLTITQFTQNIRRGEMAEMIYRLHANVFDQPSHDYDSLANKGPALINKRPLITIEARSAGLSDINAVLQPQKLPFSGLPPVSTPYTDPVFGTALIRFTDAGANGAYSTHSYSQLQAFSNDSAYVLIGVPTGTAVMRVQDGTQAPIGVLSYEFSAIRWHPTLFHTLLFFARNEQGAMEVRYADADSGKIWTHFTFPARYAQIMTNPSFDEAAEDGQWIGGMGRTADGDGMIFSLDLEAKKLGVEHSLSELYFTACRPDPEWGNVDPDWIAPSPLGNYLVINWAADGEGRCQGQEILDIRTGAFLGHSYFGHQHGDLAVLPDGKTQVFVTSGDGTPGSGFPGIVYHTLPSGADSPHLIATIPWHGLSHLSCRGPRGFCMVTSYQPQPDWAFHGVLENEIYAIRLDNGAVRRLTHHRSSNCGYWVQPRATISSDGKYIAFDSDYFAQTGGQNSCRKFEPELGGGEVYFIILPDDFLSTLTSPKPLQLP